MAQPLRYPASRYRLEAPPDLGARTERERLSPAALKAFFNIMARWKVRDEDARALLGGVSNGPFYEMKRHPDRMLDADRLTRICTSSASSRPSNPAPARARRRVGAPAEPQPRLRGRDAAGLPGARRAARHADRAPPARRAPGRVMALPPIRLVRQLDTHRLVPARRGDSVLAGIADDDAHLQAIFDLDAATNDRLLAEHGRLPGIGPEELVFGVPHAGGRQRGLLPRPPARRTVQRTGPRRLVRGVRAGHVPGGGRLPQVGRARRDRPVRGHGHLRRLSGRRQREPPRPAPRARLPGVARPGELRGVAGARRASARGGLARRGLPERPPRGRHVRGLLPPGARRQRPPDEELPVHVEGRAGPGGDAGTPGVARNGVRPRFLAALRRTSRPPRIERDHPARAPAPDPSKERPTWTA